MIRKRGCVLWGGVVVEVSTGTKRYTIRFSVWSHYADKKDVAIAMRYLNGIKINTDLIDKIEMNVQ